MTVHSIFLKALVHFEVYQVDIRVCGVVFQLNFVMQVCHLLMWQRVQGYKLS